MVLSFLGGGKKPSENAANAFAILAEVRAYWEGLRKDGRIPARAELDPRGMMRALDRTFVAERIGTGLARMRIAGASLADLGGMDVKGMPLSVFFVPEARTRLADAMERMFLLPAATEIHLEAERAIGRPALRARLLLLPLLSQDGTRNLVLGCMATEGEIGRAPRRFAIDRVIEERLILPQYTAQPAPDMFAFAEPAAPAYRPAPAAPKLRLVYSAD